MIEKTISATIPTRLTKKNVNKPTMATNIDNTMPIVANTGPFGVGA
jgi:hypothetical protein